MDKFNRAVRRHHRARLKRNRAHYWGGELSPIQIGKIVGTPKCCGCWMCGNPRRTGTDDTPHGMTRQEYKHLLSCKADAEQDSGEQENGD